LDVVLHSMGRIGHHITQAEYRGELLKQMFDSCRHRIRNGLGWLWHSHGQNRKGWVYYGPDSPLQPPGVTSSCPTSGVLLLSTVVYR
jgi:hypothetical protein